ncbi:hypothetical protein [Clostridium sp.]|uniref:hypothetical protein n=1 Tax=Clostridium sp. TaxID=1506 RepID=UPI0032174B15
MIDSRSISKGIAEIVVVISLIFMIYGILKVNLTLPKVTRESSSFHVTYSEEPIKLTLNVGEFNIIFNGDAFEGFVRGTSVIGDSIKELVKP